jgi:hypothetical protein
MNLHIPAIGPVTTAYVDWTVPWADTKDYGSFAAAHAAAVSAGRGIILTTDVTISGATTVTVPVKRVRGGKFTKSGSGTLTFNSGFDAGDALYDQIFFGFGVTDIAFGYNSVPFINAAWFGAIADGDAAKATANVTAIQTAINSSGTNGIPVILNCGANAHIINSFLTMSKFQYLCGIFSQNSYSPARIRTTTTFADTKMIYIDSGNGANTQAVNVKNIWFEALAGGGAPIVGVSAITSNATGIMTICNFEELFFSTDKGMNLGVYEQENLHKNLNCYIGNQTINSQGNLNKYIGIRHTGQGAAGYTDPPIYLHDIEGGYADFIHTEFVNAATRDEFLHLKNVSNFSLNNGIWIENSNNSGINILADNCWNVKFGDITKYLHVNGKLKLINNSYVHVSESEYEAVFGDAFDIELGSVVRVGTFAKSGAYDGDYSLWNGRLVVDETIDRQSWGAEVSRINKFYGIGGSNIMSNPNFTKGTSGYTDGSANATVFEAIANTNGLGNMLHVVGPVIAANQFTRTENYTTYANVPMTISGFAKITSGTSTRTLQIYGSVVTGAVLKKIAIPGSGWQHFSYTIVPTSASITNFVFNAPSLDSTEHYYLSNLQVTYGASALPDAGVVKNLLLDGHNIFYDTAAPLTGTYAVGDMVVNSTPADGAPKGWRCITAGTPGIWVSEGNLSQTPVQYDYDVQTLPGLIAYWTFNGTLNATRGSINFTGTTTYGTGKVHAQAATFNGTTQSIQTASNINLSGTNKATYVAWIKIITYEVTTFRDIISHVTGLTPILSMYGQDAGDPLRIQIAGNVGSNSATYDKASFGLDDGAYHLIAWTMDKSQAANEVDLYIDGVLKVPTSRPNTNNNTDNLQNDKIVLGSRQGSSAYSNVAVDGLAVFNRVLTATEILALYQAGL